MNLDDPRKRLAIARANNPSIRVSIAPKQTGNVNVVQPADTNMNFKAIGAPEPQQPAVRFNVQKGLDAGMKALIEGPQKFTHTAGNVLADIVTAPKNIIDQAGIGVDLGGGSRITAASNADKFRKFATEDYNSGRLTKQAYDAKIAKINELTKNFSQQKTAAEVKRGVMYDPSSAAIDVATGGAGGTGTVKVLENGLKNVRKAVVGFFKGNTAKEVSSIATDIAKETNPQAIQRALNIDQPTAQYLANETNPDVVKSVLKQIEIDPSLKLNDNVRSRLQDEGITAVRQKDNPYGAEYNNGVIDVKDPSYATDANLYHELGHHIYRTKLTPEEKALFKDVNGPARAQAVGRKGYTQEDLISEDFSDMLRKAMTGHLDEVPENLRPVIVKYAKSDAAEALRIPSVVNKAKDALKDPKLANAVAKYSNSQSPDSLTTLVNLLSGTTNKGDVRRVIESLDLGVDGNTKNRLVKDLVKTDNPKGVAQRVLDAMNEAEATKAAPVTEQAVGEGVAKTQTGVADTPLTTPQTAPLNDAGTTFAQQADNTPDVSNLLNKDTTPDEVQQILDAAKSAKGSYDKAIKGRKVEHATRIDQAHKAFDAEGGGEAGYKAMLSHLGGKYTASDYTPISLDKEVENAFLNKVKNSDMQDWEKFNTMNSLRKIWGAQIEKPAAHDYNYIRRFFNENYGEGVGDELATTLKESIDKGGSVEDVVSNISGLPRALMATGDLSGGFRQALPLGTRFPKIWANANVESVKYAFNPKYYEQEMKKIASAPDYNVVADKMGVDLTGVGAMQDEAFIGTGIAERLNVPLLGKKAEGMSMGDRLEKGYGPGTIVQGADRAYTGVLTRMRYDVASKLVKDAGGPENFVKNMENIYGDKSVRKGLVSGRTTASDRAMRSLGEVINTFTGRGGMKGGLLDTHMKTASATLFAPRLWAANIQRLNPVWYGKLWRDNPQAAKLALSAQGTFLSVAGTVLALAAAAGAEVGTNMGSADFGKIKVGNTRYDILGGQQQNLVQAYRQFTGTKVDSTTGETDVLGDGFGAKNRFDLALDMFENKSNPLLGFGIKLMQLSAEDTGDPFVKKDQYGNDFNIPIEGSKLLYPLGIQGSIETSQDVGDPIKGTLMNSPSFLGVGVQTYGNIKTKDQGTDSNGKIAFKGKVTEDMVLDNNGDPMLDDKGKVIKAKFDNNASDIQKQAALKKAQKSAYTAEAKRLLSKEDKDIYAAGQADESSLNDSQLNKYKQIKQWVSDYGKNIDVPKEVKSDQAKTFYSKWNSMTETDQKNWLKQAPDDNAKSIAEAINKQRASGLSEYKPSNALAKAYAEYEKDIQGHPDYTEVDKRQKAKEFQKFAYKLNYTNTQRDIYGASISDTETLLADGSISKEDLSAAINMDNELYNSGLNGTLKFSKSFRNRYGYAIPAGKDGSGGGGGKGSGDSTPRAYLADLLPSMSAGGKSVKAPEFSAKRRTSGISFKDVNAPKTSNSRKVSIKL